MNPFGHGSGEYSSSSRNHFDSHCKTHLNNNKNSCSQVNLFQSIDQSPRSTFTDQSLSCIKDDKQKAIRYKKLRKRLLLMVKFFL